MVNMVRVRAKGLAALTSSFKIRQRTGSAKRTKPTRIKSVKRIRLSKV